MKKLFTILFVMASVHAFAQSRAVMQEKPITIKGTEQQASAVTPANGAIIPAGEKMKFAWAPALSGPAIYKLKIVEIKGDQSPDQALRSNKPHFEKDSLRDAIYQYPSMAPAFATGMGYAWNVQAFNREGKPVGTNATSSFKVAKPSGIK